MYVSNAEVIAFTDILKCLSVITLYLEGHTTAPLTVIVGQVVTERCVSVV